MPRSHDEPVLIDLYAARAQWHALLQAVNQGQSFLITRDGRAFATLSPAQPTLSPENHPSLFDPDTAQRIRALADQYQHDTLAALLVLPEDVLTRLIQTGLVSDDLFRRLTVLETLAQIIFPSAQTGPGHHWLTRSHRQLKHHPPLFVLRRALLQDDQLTATILKLARAAFPI